MSIQDQIEQIKACVRYLSYVDAAKLVEHLPKDEAILACQVRAVQALREADRAGADGAITQVCDEVEELLSARPSGLDVEQWLRQEKPKDAA